MHNIDQALVIGFALFVARKIAEISAGRKHSIDAGNLRDLVGLRSAAYGFDHLDQNHVVVDSVAIAA